LDIPKTDKETAHKQFLLKQSKFYNILQVNKYTEIINLPEPHLLRHNNIRFNLGPFLGHNNVYYQSLDEFKEHIANIIYLLKTFSDYQCFLQQNSLYKNVQIQVRENAGVFFTKESETLFSLYLDQPTITQVFYNFLDNMVSGFSKHQWNRRKTIAKLEQYLYV